MDIFGIGPLEIIFILLIAMVVVGPRNMGKTGRMIGSFLNRLYRSENWKLINEASRNLRNLPNRLAREAALDELDAVHKDIAETSKTISDTGRNFAQEVQDLDVGLRAWQAPSPDAVDTKQDTQDQAPGTDASDG
jgi:Sec-independent protein translocase protein TatA